MKGVILAGGFGTRIQPLTNSIPKPMLPVANRPIMEHVVHRLKEAGIEEIVVLLYYQAEVIKNYFKDGSDFGVKITYVQPEADYGTAGAVKQAQNYLNETFIIVSGDVITDFNLSELIAFHKSKSSKFTLALYSVENPLQFGVVITNKEGKVLKFLEKPGWGEVFSDTVNTGIYVVEPEILNYIPEDKPFDFAMDLFPKLMKSGIDLWALKMRGYWRDIGNIDSYRDVHKDIFAGLVKIRIPGRIITTKEARIYVEEGTEIPENVSLKGTVILGKNVKVGEGSELKNCVIGNNTVIGRNVKLFDSVLWWNVSIDEESEIRNGVICNDVKIGKRVKAKEGVVIAEDCEVEDEVLFLKDVVVWPEKVIEKGSVVTKNIVWESKWEKGIFKGNKVIGRINVELTPDNATKLGMALGSVLPPKSTVILARDYHRASRTIKRSFLGGILSTGINVIDLHLSPVPVMRFTLTEDKKAVCGVYFSISQEFPGSVEICVFDENGLPIDTNFQKKIERVFFREAYRFETFTDLGLIKEKPYFSENYVTKLLSSIDGDSIKLSSNKVVYDALHSPISPFISEVLGKLEIENVILNALYDERKLSRISTYASSSEGNVSKVLKALSYDVGFVMEPSATKLKLVDDRGRTISGDRLLLVVLMLLDKSAEKQLRVYLPVWAPEVLDAILNNVIVERGKFTNLRKSFIEDFYMLADTDGSFTFTEFSYSPDALYASLKIMEMLTKLKVKVSEIYDSLPEYYFLHEVVSCSSEKKGTVLRKISEMAEGKEASFIEGVKIYEDYGNWVLVLPDSYKDLIHVYVQSTERERAEELIKNYMEIVRGICKK